MLFSAPFKTGKGKEDSCQTDRKVKDMAFLHITFDNFVSPASPHFFILPSPETGSGLTG